MFRHMSFFAPTPYLDYHYSLFCHIFMLPVAPSVTPSPLFRHTLTRAPFAAPIAIILPRPFSCHPSSFPWLPCTHFPIMSRRFFCPSPFPFGHMVPLAPFSIDVTPKACSVPCYPLPLISKSCKHELNIRISMLFNARPGRHQPN